jgi:hypothetical protein
LLHRCGSAVVTVLNSTIQPDFGWTGFAEFP